MAVEFVDAERIAELNLAHRGKEGPTDVLSFPVDEDESFGPRELGDVVICPEHTEDLLEAVVHGVLHLTGMDHETDEGEMLALQAEIRSWLDVSTGTRSGFVALAGRPNVGKSTLVNAMVGHKVAIVSDKPQTTRRAIRGVVTKPDHFQLVLTDLPGVQRPRDALTQRMQRRVETELAESDAALLVLNGEQGVGGPGDRFIAEALAGAKVPVVIAVNKVDAIRRDPTVAALQAADDLGLDAEVFPISARTGRGVAELAEHLAGLLPEGPFYFPPEEVSDQPERVMLAELVREQVLRRTRQEVPHAVEVQIDELEERDGLDRRARVPVDGDRVPEGHPDRLPRRDDQVDRHRRAARARARARHARAPRPLRARPPLLARRRRAA